MAKKSDKTTSDIVSEIERQFGKVVKSGQDYVEEKREVLSASPLLDQCLHGGIPEGSWVTCAGKSGIGKTTLAMRVAANAQQQGRQVFFISAEARYEKKNSTGTRGLLTEPPHLNIIESTEDCLLDAEDFVRIMSLIIHGCPRAMLIVDSPSAFSTSDQKAEGVEAQNRGGTNKIYNEFVRQHAQVVRVNKTLVWNNLHMMINQGQYGGYIEKVPETLRYLSSVRLIGRFAKDWTVGTEKKLVGQTVRWDVEKSAFGNSGLSCDGYLRYGTGIDIDYEQLVMALEIGLMTETSKGRFTLDFAGNDPPKCHGLEKAWELLQEKPELSVKLREKLVEMTGES